MQGFCSRAASLLSSLTFQDLMNEMALRNVRMYSLDQIAVAIGEEAIVATSLNNWLSRETWVAAF